MIIDRLKLIKALETVKPGLASKEMIEQSTSFCFIKGNVVTYNDEISISCPLSGLDMEGAISAFELHAFISKVKLTEIDLEIKENELIIKAGKSKAALKLNVDVVLPIEEIGVIKKWKKLPDNFCSGLNFCMPVCSRNMSRPLFTCVHVNGDSVEGSDSFRIAKYTLTSKTETKPFLIPANVCSKVIKMFPSHIAEGEGWVHFKTEDGAVLSCRIFEEKYPEVVEILHVKGTAITFPGNLLSILDKASIFSKREHILDESITIIIESRMIKVISASETGRFEEKERIAYTGEPITFSIPPYLLKDILKQTSQGIINAERLRFEGDNWEYVTMVQ